jgi:hypothetical protein
MKSLRVFLILLNFVLIGVLGYLTVKYFFSDFFTEKTLTTLTAEEYLPPVAPRRYVPWLVYGQLAVPLAEPPKVEEPLPQVETPQVNVQQIVSRIKVYCVVYDKNDTQKRGLIADVDGNPFYIVVGGVALEEPLLILKSVSEVETGKRYILKFADKDNKDIPIEFKVE